VHIEAKVTTEQEEVGAIQKRVKEFNDRLTGRWQVYQELRPQTKPQWAPVEGQGHFFAITLQSDAILKRPDGRPTIILDGEILERATRPPEKCVEPGTGFQAQLIRSFAGYDYRGGWNTAWGLPKNTEVIARMGSVYLFWTESMDYDALIRLEREGVGEGRAAGFGRVRVCDEFHTILWEGAK
jgi:CRISPR-associated protein Csx10